jgi:hypothetical protein
MELKVQKMLDVAICEKLKKLYFNRYVNDFWIYEDGEPIACHASAGLKINDINDDSIYASPTIDQLIDWLATELNWSVQVFREKRCLTIIVYDDKGNKIFDKNATYANLQTEIEEAVLKTIDLL